MNASLSFVLGCMLLQTAPSPEGEDVQQLIKKITPVAVANVRQGMAYRITESRSRYDRLEAIEKLGTIGDRAASAVPILAQLILDPYEPQSFKLAEIDVLKTIGPTAIQSLRSLRQLTSSENVILSTAAERALLHIEASSEQLSLRNTLDSLYPLLMDIFAHEDRRLLPLVNTYSRQPGAQSLDETFREIEAIVIDSKSPERLIAKLLGNPSGQLLGRKLLNASRIDGKSLSRQSLSNGNQHYGFELLDNLDSRESTAKQILEDASVTGSLWENVFKRYQSYIKNLNEVDGQERQRQVAIWLRGVSARPAGRGELILACLLDFWASSNASASFKFGNRCNFQIRGRLH